MSKVFSCPSMSFDHDPNDSELTCLLGDSSQPFSVKVVETADSLAARAWLLPMKWIVPWMALVAAGITCGVLFMAFANHGTTKFASLFFWVPIVFLAFLWLLALPSFLGILLFVNRYFAKKGDYFSVDKMRHALTAGQPGRTFRADEIIAFTELTRWYRQRGEWSTKRQTGVLVRAADRQVELHPLVNGAGKRSLADQLASVFQVPVRRIELSRAESKALKDC
jgi:hypothetical protein